MYVNSDKRCKFRANDLVAMSDDKSDRRSSGNGKVACHDAVTVTRHVGYIAAEADEGVVCDSNPSASVRLYSVSSRFYSPSYVTKAVNVRKVVTRCLMSEVC